MSDNEGIKEGQNVGIRKQEDLYKSVSLIVVKML
jgi:hypothetical protein